MTGPDEELGGGEFIHSSSREILLAVMSQQFPDDSLQSIITIIISLIELPSPTPLTALLPGTQFSIWLLFVIKIPPKHNFLQPN